MVAIVSMAMVGRLEVKGMYYSYVALNTMQVLVCRISDQLTWSRIKEDGGDGCKQPDTY